MSRNEQGGRRVKNWKFRANVLFEWPPMRLQDEARYWKMNAQLQLLFSGRNTKHKRAKERFNSKNKVRGIVMSKLILFHPEISEKLIIIENLPLVKL